MSLPVTVPFTFGNATTTQSLSSLDTNFTTITNSVNGLTNGASQINVASISATGTANATTYLRGDGAWATVSGGGGSGTVTSINANSTIGFTFTGGPVTSSGTLTLSGPTPGTSGNVLTSNGTVWLSSAGAYPLTSGTAVASTSGTSIDFTSIPSWAKRVTVMFTGVSTSGTSEVIFRLGTSGGVQATGYLSSSSVLSTGVSAVNDTTGFRIYNAGGAATDLRNGALTLALLDSATGTWSATGIFGQSDAARNNFIGGSKALSGTLDRVRITTIGGTDTFDAGSINILYE
jgi:hypothetical protein